MDDGIIPQLFGLAFMLLLSAYFSGTETAFLSLSSLEQESLKRRSTPFLKRIIDGILSSPDEILITVLTGNMVVNVIASTLAEVLGERVFPVDSDLFSIIAMTVLLLIIGEMTPKNLAVNHSLYFAKASAVPLYYLHHIFKPLRWGLNLFNRLHYRLFPIRDSEGKKPERRIILPAVQIGFKEGILDQSELNLFESFFDFRNKSAVDVMIPRTEVKGIDISTRISWLIQNSGKLKRVGKSSLIPVYQKDMDHLLGYIDLKDLLPFKYGLKTGERLGKILKEFVSVPESKNCAELMVEMRDANTEMALVVDEYGGTAGIITFQNLLDVLFGYFYPAQYEKLIKISQDCYNVPGNLKIDKLVNLFHQDIPTENQTVAGLITHQLEEIPAVGTKMVIDKLEFTVRKIARNRILTVDVRRLA